MFRELEIEILFNSQHKNEKIGISAQNFRVNVCSCLNISSSGHVDDVYAH